MTTSSFPFLEALVFDRHWEFWFTPENNTNVIKAEFPRPLSNHIPHVS